MTTQVNRLLNSLEAQLGYLLLGKELPLETRVGRIFDKINGLKKSARVMDVLTGLEAGGWEYDLSLVNSEHKLSIQRPEWSHNLYNASACPTWKEAELEALLNLPDEEMAEVMSNHAWSITQRVADAQEKIDPTKTIYPQDMVDSSQDFHPSIQDAPPVKRPEKITSKSSKDEMVCWIVWERYLHGTRPVTTHFYHVLQDITRAELRVWITRWQEILAKEVG
jgi:hypothetical protein